MVNSTYTIFILMKKINILTKKSIFLEFSNDKNVCQKLLYQIKFKNSNKWPYDKVYLIYILDDFTYASASTGLKSV